MKATGIIRRIDDLGRVVIPKEIRRSMNIKEGDPLEIYIDSENNGIIFIPYKATGYDEKIKNLMEEIYTEMTWYDDREEFHKAYDYLHKAFKAIKKGE